MAIKKRAVIRALRWVCDFWSDTRGVGFKIWAKPRPHLNAASFARKCARVVYRVNMRESVCRSVSRAECRIALHRDKRIFTREIESTSREIEPKSVARCNRIWTVLQRDATQRMSITNAGTIGDPIFVPLRFVRCIAHYCYWIKMRIEKMLYFLVTL